MKLKLNLDHFLFEIEMNAEEATRMIKDILGNIIDKGAFADMERSSAESLNKLLEGIFGNNEEGDAGESFPISDLFNSLFGNHDKEEKAPEEEKSDAKDEQSDSGAFDATEELEEDDESEAAYKAWLEIQYMKADTLLDLVANSKEEIEVRIEAAKAFRGFTQHHEDRKGDWMTIRELLKGPKTPTYLKLELIRCF